MKKYFLVAFALLAGIILSSFTSTNRTVALVDEDPLFWFDGSGYTGSGAVTPSYRKENGPCDDEGQYTCELGYAGTEFVIEDDPTSGINGNPSAEIKKLNP